MSDTGSKQAGGTRATGGDTVRIKIKAGLVEPNRETRFVGVVEPGTEGIYLRKHPTLKGWHLVQVGELYAPLRGDQFEVIQ